MGMRLDDLMNAPTVASVPTQISQADAQNMGPSAPISYTQPKPPPSLLERGEEDVEKPFIQLQHTLGASMSWLGDNIKDETPFGDLGSRVTRAGIVLQERAISTLRDKFSNFTPNMLDDLVGAVPTIAGFMGLAAASTPAIATGALAAGAGLGIGAEEFGKLKQMGKTTPQADALATAIGVPAGGVMAMGFGQVSELVEPWFKAMLGTTISKMVGGAAAAAVGLGAQAAVTDTGEMVEGVEKADAMKVLTDTVHNAIMGGVLGGGLGLTFALKQHASVVKQLTNFGFSPKEANIKATAVLSQGSHVLMDAIEQKLAYTKDENARIQAPPAKGEVQPNVLARSGIPEDLDQNFPSVQEPEPNAEVVAMSKNNKYVRLEPLNIEVKATDKLTGEEVVKKYVGGRDVQRLRNSEMYHDWTKTIEDEKGTPFLEVEAIKAKKMLNSIPLDKLIEQSPDILKQIETQDGKVRVYRGGNRTTIEQGDYVSFNKDYAKGFAQEKILKSELIPFADIKVAGGMDSWARQEGFYLKGESGEDFVNRQQIRISGEFSPKQLADLKQQAIFRSDASPEFLKLVAENPRAAAEQLHQNLKELFDLKIDPKEKDIKATEEWLKSMQSVAKLALNPTPAMKQVMTEGKTYYDEQGAVSQAMGTTKDILKNYHSSRLYKPNSVANSAKLVGATTRKWSAHSLARVYPNSWMASADGMQYRTENFSDAAYAHAHEMTEVNYSRQAQNALVEKKPMPLAAWIRPFTAPEGWKVLDEVTKLDFPKDKAGNFMLDENGNPIFHEKVFAGPAGLVDAMRPIVEPNYLDRIWGYKTFTKLQDFSKTGLLSLSLFHDKNLGLQVLSSAKGFETLANLPNVLKNDLMSTPTFREQEKFGVKYGVTTPATQAIQDVWLGMNKGEDTFSKVLQAPILKQVVDAVDAHTKLLFNGEQRYYKTTTFSNLMSSWLDAHPNATPEEIDAAGYGFAAHVNSVFGGLNWEMLGWTRTQVALARAVMLAPDWTVSGILTGKYASTEGFKSAKGNAARLQLTKVIIGGIVAANIISYLRTGHSTFENKKGHWFDAETEPDVYDSMIAGGAGEVLKFGSDLLEEQGAKGFARYSEGKLAPIPSAGVRFFSGVTYSGGEVWRGHSALEKNINGFWNVLGPAMGIPIGVSSGVDYLMREPDKSISGFSFTASGLERFSKSGSRRRFR